MFVCLRTWYVILKFRYWQCIRIIIALLLLCVKIYTFENNCNCSGSLVSKYYNIITVRMLLFYAPNAPYHNRFQDTTLKTLKYYIARKQILLILLVTHKINDILTFNG